MAQAHKLARASPQAPAMLQALRLPPQAQLQHRAPLPQQTLVPLQAPVPPQALLVALPRLLPRRHCRSHAHLLQQLWFADLAISRTHWNPLSGCRFLAWTHAPLVPGIYVVIGVEHCLCSVQLSGAARCPLNRVRRGFRLALFLF